MLALLFSTARRHNGYSGLHDLAVGSRVILRAACQSRPRLEIREERLPDVDDTKTVGPYHVLDTLGTNDAGQFLLGYDMRLLRRVWIHKLPAGSPAIPIERRNMGRVGRLRWINGRRDGAQCWDVYESLSGQPLLKPGKFRPIITDRRTWNSFMGLTISPPHRKLAERIIAERPAPSDAELAKTVATMAPILKEIASINDRTQQISPAAIGAIQFAGIWLVFVTLAGLIAVIAFRRGLIMLIFGVDYVTRSGALASRPRMLWRTIVFNAPVLSAPIVLALVFPLVQELVPSLLVVVGALAVVAVWSSLLPSRGLTDRLSGTYPVPR